MSSGVLQMILFYSISILEEYTPLRFWIQLFSFLGIVHHIQRHVDESNQLAFLSASLLVSSTQLLYIEID